MQKLKGLIQRNKNEAFYAITDRATNHQPTNRKSVIRAYRKFSLRIMYITQIANKNAHKSRISRHDSYTKLDTAFATSRVLNIFGFIQRASNIPLNVTIFKNFLT